MNEPEIVTRPDPEWMARRLREVAPIVSRFLPLFEWRGRIGPLALLTSAADLIGCLDAALAAAERERDAILGILWGGRVEICAPPDAAKERGLHDKYRVERTDGRDKPGEKHHGCRYFVIDMDHDPYAVRAIAAYADAIRDSHPALYADLSAWLRSKEQPPQLPRKAPRTQDAYARCRRCGGDVPSVFHYCPSGEAGEECEV